MRLADVQESIRDALVTGAEAAIGPILTGGTCAAKRLAIHQRHYAASLVTALLDRFPATVWLMGSTAVAAVARQFVREHPPARPCIAEYGEMFPWFLGAQVDAVAVPYLQQFSELEWHLGRLSLAIEIPAVVASELADVEGDRLAESTLTLQPGLHYLQADWAIDALMSAYLSDTAPTRFVLQRGHVCLELRGVRGHLRMTRLTQADFAFRSALSRCAPLADAALTALDIDRSFDAGAALRALLDEGAVVAVNVDPA